MIDELDGLCVCLCGIQNKKVTVFDVVVCHTDTQSSFPNVYYSVCVCVYSV